jgi:predicted lipoprotein with Yx(FWY)xxD motif
MAKSFWRAVLPGTFLFALLLSVAYAAGPPQVTQTDKGPALADAKGMTLYVFDKDSGGKSACTGKCAENWPPLTADAAAAPPAGYSVITRDDGQKQWAYKGKPLYGWVKDTKPGDTTGDGVGGSWHIAAP